MTEARARRRHVLVLGVLLVLTTVVSVLAAVSSPPSDEWLYLLVRDSDIGLPWGVLADVRSLPVVAVLALPVLLARRCRVTLAAVALGLVAAVALGLALQWLVARPRPYDSGMTGTDSYPALMLLVLAFLVTCYGLWPRFAGRARSWTVLAAALWLLLLGRGPGGARRAEVAAGRLGALLVGAGVGTLVKVAVETPRLHRRCPDACPWDRRTRWPGRSRSRTSCTAASRTRSTASRSRGPSCWSSVSACSPGSAASRASPSRA